MVKTVKFSWSQSLTGLSRNQHSMIDPGLKYAEIVQDDIADDCISMGCSLKLGLVYD